MTTTAAKSKTVLLKSSDGEIFKVGVGVAMILETIKPMIDNDFPNRVISISNVDANILSKIIEFCMKHAADETETHIDLKSFDSEFIKINQDMILDLAKAANYLNINSLLDLIFEKTKNEEVGQYFYNVNDYTPPGPGETSESQWACS